MQVMAMLESESPTIEEAILNELRDSTGMESKHIVQAVADRDDIDVRSASIRGALYRLHHDAEVRKRTTDGSAVYFLPSRKK